MNTAISSICSGSGGEISVKQDRGERQSGEGAGETQDAAAEGGAEVGFEDDGDGHGRPIGAMPADAARDGVGDHDADGQPERMPEGGGFEREVGAQDGENAGEA